MKLVDDRTAEQKKTHTFIYGGTDRVLSGWYPLTPRRGEAGNGPSYAFWAIPPQFELALRQWVDQRGDIYRLRQVSPDYRPPSGPGHCHIYAISKRTHPVFGPAGIGVGADQLEEIEPQPKEEIEDCIRERVAHVYCGGCQTWIPEPDVDTIRVEEGITGEDRVTFRCHYCGKEGESRWILK